MILIIEVVAPSCKLEASSFGSTKQTYHDKNKNQAYLIIIIYTIDRLRHVMGMYKSEFHNVYFIQIILSPCYFLNVLWKLQLRHLNDESHKHFFITPSRIIVV